MIFGRKKIKKCTHRSFYTKKTFFLISGIFLFFVFLASGIYAYTVINGDVTIDILDYVPANGWQAGAVYDGKVTVNFGDTTSLNKEIIITLPEGMRFTAYPVVGAPASGSPGYTVESGSILEQFISSVTEPSQQAHYPSYNGALTYQITQACESIEIPFKLTVDENVYYGPKTITDAIASTASKGGVNIGDASMDVDAIGYAFFYQWSGDWITPSILAGSTESLTAPRLSVGRHGDLYPQSFYAQKIEMHYYYPKELEVTSTSYPSNLIENDTVTGDLHFEWNDRYGNPNYIRPNLSAENTAAGLYTAGNGPDVTVTTYDGTVVGISQWFYSPLKVNVLDSVDNKLQLTVENVGYYEQSDDYYIVGPRMRIYNDQATVKTDQHVEYTIDPNYEVIQVVFPVDVSIGSLDDIQYKTNLNATLRTATSGQIIPYGTTGYSISVDSLGLSANEYITYAVASIGSTSKGYQSTGTSYRYISNASRIVGKLKDGISTANVTVHTYATLPDESIEPNSEASLTRTVSRSSIPTTSLRAAGTADTVMNAGETNRFTFNLTGSTYYYSNALGLINPTMYVRIPENTSIDLSGLTVTSNFDGALPHTVTGPYTTTTGEEFIAISITGKVGSLFDLDQYHRIDVSFDFIAGLGAGGNYLWTDYVFWRDDVGVSYTTQNGYPSVVSDVFDADNDGDLTEKLVPTYNRDLSIISKEELLIDTYITPEGESRKPPYDGTESTAIGFTPGTTAKYTLDMLNNRTDSVNSVDAYVPIPKDGNDFGANFQENEFYWNMKLDGTPTVTVIDQFGTDITATAASNYAITYSENATTEANYQGATYTGSPSTNTTMIRVENTVGVPAGEQAIFEFDYVVDETIASVTADPTKLGATNDFKPYYYFNSGTSGWQSGTRVGATLEIGQIAGQAFLDQDIDGIYNNSDTLLENKTIDLYKHNGTSYVFHSTTTTDNNGSYTFDELSNGIYRVNFTNVPTAVQEFTKQNQGSDESLDSDPPFTGALKGFVDNINPTEDIARETDAGVINYDPTTDLSAILNKTSTSIKKTNAQTTFTEQLTQTISPSFFTDIQAASQPIVWASSDPSTVSVSNGLIQGSQTGNATITLTITDMYGNTDNAQTTVTVTSNDIPTITASNTTISLNQQFDPFTGVTAADTEDGDLTNRIIVTASNLNTETLGDYTITYAVTDNDGNTTSQNRTITVDSIAPTVETGSVSDVTTSQVTLNAQVTQSGGEIVSREIDWGTTSGSYANTCTATSGEEGHYACTITGLTPATTYYYRAKVTNTTGTDYGQEKNFTTQAAETQQSTIETEGIITITGDAIFGGN